MNPGHQQLCSSAEWAERIRDLVLPWALADLDLGPDLLEIGPGYGAATRVLVQDDARRLTALEVDDAAVLRLTEEFGEVARIVPGDGARMPFEDGAFSAVVCFTMLHHVPTVAQQDQLFAEAARVLRPGGVFLGTDSKASTDLANFHDGDVYNPLPLDTLAERLTRAGLSGVAVDHVEFALRFRGTNPA